MIIKGLFRRYERWNPVHPTYGAFWGMGVGIGCGVGWGPGFGPDVIGYVGAGCGVGFSVGFTFAGFGIGLPANYLYEVPYSAFVTTRNGAVEMARSSGFQVPKSVGRDRQTIFVPDVSNLQREVSEKLSSFKQKVLLDERLNSFDIKSLLLAPSKSIWASVGEFHKQLSKHHKGILTCILYIKVYNSNCLLYGTTVTSLTYGIIQYYRMLSL
uniref:Cadmium-induced protein AS8 n=1 Tax=Cannabis sativa TaxID=3483 RepID=A0A803R4E8_CANSA